MNSFDINFARRQLNEFQKAEWAYKVKYPALKKRTDVYPRIQKAPHNGSTAEQVAKVVGISSSTFNRSKKIIETYNKGLLSNQVMNELRAGKESIKDVYKTIFRIYTGIAGFLESREKGKGKGSIWR